MFSFHLKMNNAMFSITRSEGFKKLLEKCILIQNASRIGQNSFLDFNSVRNSSTTSISQTVTTTTGAATSHEAPQVLSPPLIHHLERTSLVDFENAEALSRLTEAVNFANQLFEVKTEGVEPLVNVLENEALFLRDDKSEKCNRKEILRNASLIEEDYFIAPPGNVPLEPSSNDFLQSDSPERLETK